MCTKKQHQSKWVKTKGDSWMYRNNYFRFWSNIARGSASKNKAALQQLFTTRTLTKVKGEQFDKPLFLDGWHKQNDTMCGSFVNRLVSVESLLNRFFVCTKRLTIKFSSNANHAIKIKNYGSVVIASPDTDIFVSTLHHFCKLKYFDLEELWFVSGRGNSRTFLPIHDLA